MMETVEKKYTCGEAEDTRVWNCLLKLARTKPLKDMKTFDDLATDVETVYRIGQITDEQVRHITKLMIKLSD